MISAAMAAPARGGQVVFSVDKQGQLHPGSCVERISVYVAMLDPVLEPELELGRTEAMQASTPSMTNGATRLPLRQRQRALIEHWLREHDALTKASARAESGHTALALTTTHLGKPYWFNSHWQLNWSHSQGCLALAIAPHDYFIASASENARLQHPRAGSLGIDIEMLGRARARAALVTRYFHPSEHAIAHDERGFLSLWTRKEAVLKAHGMGLRIDLKSLNTACEIIEHEHLGRWHCLSLALHPAIAEDGATQEIAWLSLSWPYALAH